MPAIAACVVIVVSDRVNEPQFKEEIDSLFRLDRCAIINDVAVLIVDSVVLLLLQDDRIPVIRVGTTGQVHPLGCRPDAHSEQVTEHTGLDSGADPEDCGIPMGQRPDTDSVQPNS
jgi:hypothetical protein